jgi:hypothetical protein
MTDHEPVKILIDGKPVACNNCSNTTFKPSNMFFSHMRNDSTPNEMMTCSACSTVINTSGSNEKIVEQLNPVAEKTKLIDSILDEVFPLNPHFSTIKNTYRQSIRNIIAKNKDYAHLPIEELRKILSNIVEFKKRQDERRAM